MGGKTALLFVSPTVGSSNLACSNCVVGGVDEGDLMERRLWRRRRMPSDALVLNKRFWKI